jgi:hypothetical protein
VTHLPTAAVFFLFSFCSLLFVLQLANALVMPNIAAFIMDNSAQEDRAQALALRCVASTARARRSHLTCSSLVLPVLVLVLPVLVLVLLFVIVPLVALLLVLLILHATPQAHGAGCGYASRSQLDG